MSDILQNIAEYKRAEVAREKKERPLRTLEAAVSLISPPRGFLARLRNASRPALIAEIKKASPSKGLIRADFDPAALAGAYQAGGAACLSVLTDAPSFQGAPDYLAAARQACGLPVLRKDFLLDPWQVAESRALGADAVLIILAMVDDEMASQLLQEARRYGMDALVETHDEAEMLRAGRLGADLVGVNNRDLRTFITDLSTTGRLARLAPAGAVLVSESGISAPAEVRQVTAAGAQAILVGESLMRQADVEAATRILLTAS